MEIQQLQQQLHQEEAQLVAKKHQVDQLKQRLQQLLYAADQQVSQMRRTAAQSDGALDILLKHPAEATDQRLICKVLQVSRAWRAVALQKAGPGLLSTFVKASQDELLSLAGFADWLPRHYQLVGSIEVEYGGVRDEISTPLLSLSVQSVKDPQWQLHSFKSDAPASRDLLLALPVASLTELSIDCSLSPPPIAQFSKLKQLDLNTSPAFHGFGASTIRQIAALSRLTNLSLSSLSEDSDLSLLPQQLQYLTIHISCEDPHVLLQHLTALRSLHIYTVQQPAAASLPWQLQQLSIYNAAQPGAWSWQLQQQGSLLVTFGVTGLLQLQLLDIHALAVEPVHTLSALKQLQHATLELRGLESAPLVWGQLPALCSLDLLTFVNRAEEVYKLAMSLAAATGLTSLRLMLRANGLILTDTEEVQSMYKQLTGLAKLCSLNLEVYTRVSTRYAPKSLFASIDRLSVLVGLTKLRLLGDCFEWAVASESAQLLSCLTGLEHLAVNYQHIGLLPVVGQLRQLRHLSWAVLPKTDAQQGLQHLLGLSKLTKLDGFDQAGPAALRDFWAAVKGQH